MGYIVFVAYENDAERKRIDYLLEKWSSKADIKKPRGLVFYINTDKPEEFFEELFSRLEGNVKNKVEVYRAERVSRTVKAKRRSLEYQIDEERRVVERFMSYLLSKLNASLLRYEGGTKVYNVYTRKGRGTLRVTLDGSQTTKVLIEIEGYGDVVDFLSERIGEELKLFAGD